MSTLFPYTTLFRSIPVGEPGAVVDVGGGGEGKGEGGVEAEVEGVALIVVDGGVSEAGVAGGRADGDADEAAGERAALLGDLVGISEVGLSEATEARRAEGEFPGADEGAVDGDGEVDAGVADVGVVEEVVDAVLEGVGVEQPAAEGNLHAELVFFIAFAVEGYEGGVVAVGEGEDRAGGGNERRRLIEAAIKAAEDPVEFGDAEGGADAGSGDI